MSNVSFPSVQQIFSTGNSTTVNNSTTSFDTKSSFASVLKDAINQVNNSQLESDAMTEKLVNGDNVDLSQVMIAQQKANITLQTAVETRNKVIDAYQEIMRMQV